MMNFHRQDVSAADQARRRKGCREPVGFFQASGRLVGGRGEVNSAGWHVASVDFLAVQVEHRAVITLEVKLECSEERRITHRKRVAKVARGRFGGGVGAVEKARLFAVGPIAEAAPAARVTPAQPAPANVPDVSVTDDGAHLLSVAYVTEADPDVAAALARRAFVGVPVRPALSDAPEPLGLAAAAATANTTAAS